MAKVSPPPAQNSPEYMQWNREIMAYNNVANCKPGRGLQVVCGVGYDVVSECVCTCAQSDGASFDDGWLKVLWDVFIDPELWAKESGAELKGASNDFVLGFFLGTLKAQKYHVELLEEVVERLPQAVLRINSSRSLIRYFGSGRFTRIDDTDWREWKKGTEEGIKWLAETFAYRQSRHGWFEMVREVIRLVPPTFPSWSSKGQMVAPSLSVPAQHVIGCLRWATDKMYGDYDALFTLAHPGPNRPRVPWVV